MCLLKLVDDTLQVGFENVLGQLVLVGVDGEEVGGTADGVPDDNVLAEDFVFFGGKEEQNLR